MPVLPRAASLLPLLLLGCGTKWEGLDNDGDGLSAAQGDCWDAVEGPVPGVSGADIRPGAADAAYDGVDADCAGDDDFDADGDGFVPDPHVGRKTLFVAGSGALPGGDCLDLADADFAARLDAGALDEIADAVALHGLPQPLPSAVFPGAPDAPYDDVDADCAGRDADNDGVVDDFDADGDGYAAAALADRAGLAGGDCADGAPGESADVNRAGLPLDAIFPGADDPPYDGTDQDCGGVYSVGDVLADCDLDGDGATFDDAEDGEADGCVALDCDDLDPSAVPDPDVAEVFYDGTDNNCLLRLEDGRPDVDGDADRDGAWSAGYPAAVPDPDGTVGPLPAAFDDCWDEPAAMPAGWVERSPTVFDATADWTAGGSPAWEAGLGAADVHPGALDRPYDGIDQDCRGEDADSDGVIDDFDWDGDGFATLYQEGPAGFGDDCLDCAPACAGATGALAELCALVCDDGAALALSDAENLTNLGLLPAAEVSPAAAEVYGDGTDGDCSRSSDYDADRDFYADAGVVGSPWELEALRGPYFADGVIPVAGGDCNDDAPAVNPGAADAWYDGVDQDCDGDDDYDADGDGHVRLADAGKATSSGAGTPSFGGALPADDCDDADPAVYGAGAEVWYDGVDGDCDGADDFDRDRDGYADRGRAADYRPTTYAPGTGALPTTDCNDGLAAVRPGLADAWYDGVDSDCGDNDDYDADVDGYVPSAYAGLRTSHGSGTAAFGAALPGGDCDDAAAARNPAAVEVCDSVDNDCDSLTDDADVGTGGVVYTAAHVWYPDADGDTYGRTAGLTRRCAAPAGHVATPGDCDDAVAAVNPAATEVCDGGVDNDCDALADDADGSLLLSSRGSWYADLDGDTYGAGVVSRACAAPAGRVANNADCDDARASVNPAAAEVCDGRDNDCDGQSDDADPSLELGTRTDWYRDADGDDFGDDAAAATPACAAPAGAVSVAGDCDDGAPEVNPGEPEVCNDGLDNDCDDSLGETATGGVCAYNNGAIAGVDQVTWTLTDMDGRIAGLGYALAVVPDLSGDDLPELVLGAPSYDIGNGGSNDDGGFVTVVQGTAAWTLASNLSGEVTASDRQAYRGASGDDLFGHAVAGGDFDGDGAVELFIGAPGTSPSGAANGGSVWLLDAIGAGGDVDVITGVVGATQRSGALANLYTGAALALGDQDDDGKDDLLIAAPQCDEVLAGAWDQVAPSGVSGPGRVQLVRGVAPAAGFASAAAHTTWTGSADGACAGGGLLMLDRDGDGVQEVVIAEPYAASASGLARAGRVLVVEAVGGTVSLGGEAAVEGDEVDSGLGRALAAGDLDGDGLPELLIGEWSDLTNRGAVHVLSGAALSPAATATAEALAHTRLIGGAANSFLGSSVAVVGDMDGEADGLPEVLIGAHRANFGASVEGAIYLVSGPILGGTGGTRTVSSATALALNGGAANRRLGEKVLSGGDLNGDGVPDLLAVEHQGTASDGVHLVLGLGY